MSDEYLYLSNTSMTPVFRIEGRYGRSITVIDINTWRIGDHYQTKLIHRDGAMICVCVDYYTACTFPPWTSVRHVDLQYFSSLMHCETLDFFAYLHGSITLDEITTKK